MSKQSIMAMTGGVGLTFAGLGATGAGVTAVRSLTLDREDIDDSGENLASSMAPSKSLTERSSPNDPKESIFEEISRLTKTGREPDLELLDI